MEEMLGCLGAPIWGSASLQLIPELWVLWDGLGFFCPSVLWLCAFILPSGVVEADTDQWERACDTLLMCIVTVLNHGLRNGGGVGDILRKPSKDVSGVPSFCHCRAALPPSKSLPALSPTAILQCFCPSHPPRLSSPCTLSLWSLQDGGEVCKTCFFLLSASGVLVSCSGCLRPPLFLHCHYHRPEPHLWGHY